MANDGTWNARTADEMVAHRLALLAYEQGTSEDLLRAYQKALGDVDRAFLDALAEGDAASLRRLFLLGTELDTKIRGLYESSTTILGDALTEAALAESAFLGTLPRAAWGSLTKLPNELITQMTDSPLGGKRWDTRLATDLLDERDALRRIMANAIRKGQTLAEVERSLREGTGIVETYRGRLVTIARTEIQRVASEVSLATFAATKGIGGVQWLATLDSSTCVICAPLHGKVWKYDEDRKLPPSFRPPPLHPRCFVAGTLVAGPRVTGGMSRWYEGEVIEARTESGAVFTVTPNHPMLTSRGWVAAGELHEGCDVIRSLDPERMVQAIDPDDHQVPARIEEVASPSRRTLGVTPRAVPLAPEDLHGDGGGSDVCVVWSDRLLGDRLDPALGEPLSQEHLGRRPHTRHPLAPKGLLDQVFLCLGDPALGSVCGLGPRSMLFGGARGGGELIGGGLVTHVHVGGFEPATHYVASHAAALSDAILGHAPGVEGGHFGGHREAQGFGSAARAHEPPGPQGFGEVVITEAAHAAGLLDRLSGHVSTDRVLKVTRRHFAGHVYNLETTDGWYIANGIVTHNCRCVASPVSVSFRELYKPPKGPFELEPTPGMDFESWLKRQPERRQLDFFGSRTRYDAWKAGVPLGGFTGGGRVLRLGELRARYPEAVAA